jgi:hypothetical protein
MNNGKRCPHCGALLEDGAKFCGVCGTPLPQEQPTYYNQPNGNSGKGNGAKVLIGVAIGCVVVLIVAFVLIFLLQSSSSEQTDTVSKRSGQVSTEDTLLSEEETTEEESTEEESTEEDTSDLLAADADIDAVNNRSCTVTGILYYTDSMDEPVVTLEESQDIYVNTTSGDPELYEKVTKVSLASYDKTDDEMQRYNNVEVQLNGSLWAENGTVYMDVDKIFGDSKDETEANTKKKSSTTVVTVDDDYILPDSDSRYLTDSDVAGLTVQEINYAKNEIYARHGRKFDSQELSNYFNSKDWSKGTVDADKFSTSVFNKYELKNVEFLDKKEKALGTYKLDQ